MTRLERADIARIRAQHPITAVLVSFGVQVPHAGRRFMIHCPSRAHRDSRPSCLIDSDRDRFHCFGCHAGGDIFSLVHEPPASARFPQSPPCSTRHPRSGRRRAEVATRRTSTDWTRAPKPAARR